MNDISALTSLDHIWGNLAFIYFDDHGMKMSAIENVQPVDETFIWPRYHGQPDGVGGGDSD